MAASSRSLALGRMGVVDGGLPDALSPTPYARFGDLIFCGPFGGFAAGFAAVNQS